MRSNIPFFKAPPASLNLSPDSARRSQLKGLGWDWGHQTEIAEGDLCDVGAARASAESLSETVVS